MAVSGVGAANPNGIAPQRRAPDSSSLDMDDFMQLLATQMQNQDMNSPMSNSEMMAQLTSMATVQSMNTFSELSSTQYALNLIGKEVTVADTDATTNEMKTKVGVVVGINLSDMTFFLKDNPKGYGLGNVMEVGTIPKAPEDDKDGDGKPDVDLDGDGKTDGDINGDGKPDIDLDGDGKLDVDLDGDGKPDSVKNPDPGPGTGGGDDGAENKSRTAAASSLQNDGGAANPGPTNLGGEAAAGSPDSARSAAAGRSALNAARSGAAGSRVIPNSARSAAADSGAIDSAKAVPADSGASDSVRIASTGSTTADTIRAAGSGIPNLARAAAPYGTMPMDKAKALAEQAGTMPADKAAALAQQTQAMPADKAAALERYRQVQSQASQIGPGAYL